MIAPDILLGVLSTCLIYMIITIPKTWALDLVLTPKGEMVDELPKLYASDEFRVCLKWSDGTFPATLEHCQNPKVMNTW